MFGMLGPLGCGTAVLWCGCSTSSSMFEDNTWMRLVICNRHLRIPEVQEAKVKDVWKIIIEHDVRTDEEKGVVESNVAADSAADPTS